MIEKQTVLVLGAGASQPYGFPTGGELRKLICDDLSWHDAALRDRISAQFIQRFVMRFRCAPQSTVDRFLARHTDFVNVGKLAIASILIAREFASDLSPQKDNWYGYLWSRLETDWDDFSKNKLKIITFNYDRSLEQFLLQSILQTFKRSLDESYSLAKCVPIVHVYGDLGKLGEFSTDNRSRPYRMFQEERFDSIDIGIRRLRVIGEQSAGLDQNLTEIHNTLASAEAICFLGFGFDETNFKLLKIDELLTKTKPPQIFGSTKGLEAAEVTRVRNWCNGKIVDFSANCCEKFLRHHGVLI